MISIDPLRTPKQSDILKFLDCRTYKEPTVLIEETKQEELLLSLEIASTPIATVPMKQQSVKETNIGTQMEELSRENASLQKIIQQMQCEKIQMQQQILNLQEKLIESRLQTLQQTGDLWKLQWWKTITYIGEIFFISWDCSNAKLCRSAFPAS